MLKPETAQMVEMSRLALTIEPIPRSGLSRLPAGKAGFLGLSAIAFLSDG